MHREPPGEQGYTLIEVVLTLALVASLAGLALPTFTALIAKARAKLTASEMVVMRDATLSIAKDCSGLPVWTRITGDPGPTYRPRTGRTCWKGPYMSRWPNTTPVGGSYQYYGPGRGTMAVVRVHSLPRRSAQALAQEIAGVFGATGSIRYSSRQGWMAELQIGNQYQP